MTQGSSRPRATMTGVPPRNDCMVTCGHSDAAAFLSSIVESSDDAIIGKSLDGIVLSWNRGAEEVFGYTADEMIGANITTLFPPERVFEEEILLNTMRRGEHIGHYETVRRRKDGRSIDVSISVSPIRDRSGNIIGVSKIARDITYRKLASEKQLSLDRTKALLSQKEVLLEEMEHRVLNSLQIISSILLLKVSTVECQETRSELRDAYSRVMSVATIQRHLHYSGRDGLVDVSSYMASLCDSLAKSMIGGDRPLKLIVKAESSKVESRDATNLGLIITELVINALKYAFPPTHLAGEVLVSYEAKGLDWKLVVHDNGVGCSEFQPVPKARGGLGKRLITALANNLDAVVELRTGANGTRVSITHAAIAPVVSVDNADICRGKLY